MKRLQLLAATLAVATLFTIGAPALAGNDKGKGNDHKFEHKQKKHYDDLDDAAWAELGIEKAYQLGLMIGEGKGKFNPHAPVSREAAVLTAIRLMGLEEQAKASADAELNFTDARKIDNWARGAVAVAVEKGVLPPSGDGMLRPDEPASRLWVSVLLVKALGYEAEAQSKMNVQLPFADADQIPANLRGYVAAAIDHKLVNGYDDRTFKPNKPVTRAEMAALLGRTNDQLGQRGERKGEVHGKVEAVDATAGTLTVKGAHGSVSASVYTEAAIFVDKQAAELAAVQVGMNIWIKLDGEMRITFIDARSPEEAGGGTTIGTTVSGTVTAVAQPAGGILGVVTIQPQSGVAITASVAPLATITAGGSAITLAGIHAGDVVQAQVVAGVIISLAVQTPAPPATSTVSGTVYSIAWAASSGIGSITITPATGASVTATVYSTTTVTLLSADGTTATRAITDIAVGNEVEATISGSAVASIQIIAPAVTVQGKVMAFVAPSGSTAGTLVLLADGAALATTYSIAATVPVVQGTTARSFADLTLNQSVRLTLHAGAVTGIELI